VGQNPNAGGMGCDGRFSKKQATHSGSTLDRIPVLFY